MSTGKFILHSGYIPSGDQPEAIARLIAGVEAGATHQTLQGITGSGKTFTMANVIHRLQRPTLILAPNKTLTAQLYLEMKQFFPENAVEYFVSYYDFFQPEVYIPGSVSMNTKCIKDNKKLAGDIPPASFFQCFNVMLITVCLSLSAKEILLVSGTPSFSKTTV